MILVCRNRPAECVSGVCAEINQMFLGYVVTVCNGNIQGLVEACSMLGQ